MSTRNHFDFNSGEEVPKFDALSYIEGPTNAVEAFADTYATFWFTHMAMGDKPYSFDNGNVSLLDYQCYMDILQELSNTKVSDLLKGEISNDYLKKKRFHAVDVGKYSALKEALMPFKHNEKEPLNSLNCPLFFQIRLYDKEHCVEPEGKRKKAPRVFFKLTDKGFFSVFFLDLYHELCPTTDFSGDKPVTVQEQKKAAK